MDIQRIERSDEQWDRFVWESPGGTIFHTLRFLSYHPPSRFDFVNLAIRDGERLICVIPGAAVSRDSRRILASPVGASFGGFVFGDDSDLPIMSDALAVFEAEIRAMGFDGIDLVLPPICYTSSRDQALQFLLTSRGYTLTLREATAVVPLDTFDEDNPHPVLARNLRKASREGLEVRAGKELGAFYSVLERNLSAKNVSPTHTLDELGRLFELLPDRLVLLEAVMGNKVVGGSLLVLCNDRVGLAFYICDDPEERRLRITETVLNGSICRLKRSGHRYLDLGTVSRDGEADWGLVRFKSKFSPRTYVRESYSLRFEEA
jgi:hypothetical protein